MRGERFVAVVGADELRRRTIARAFASAGFATAQVRGVAELEAERAGPAPAFVFDRFGSDALEAELARLKAWWPRADVWAVSETVRLLASSRGEDVVAEPSAQYLSCKGILERALRALAPVAGSGGSPDESVRRAKQEFENLFDAAPEPVFILSADRRVVRANRRFCERIGRSAAQVVGARCVDLLYDGSEPPGGCPCLDALASVQPVRWEARPSTLGAACACTAFRVSLADGASGIALSFRTLAAPGEVGPGAEGAQRLNTLAELAAGMAHELNNPLGAVIGFAGLLRESGSCPPEFETDLERIQHEAWRCQRIVRNLLHLARAPEPNRQATDLNQLVEQALAVSACQAGAARPRVTRDLAPGLPPLRLDPDQVEQVLLNLLANAEEATRAVEGPEIVITTRIDGADIALAVADNGPGIPADHLPRIFDPLFSTKASTGGTGLGLSVSRTLVRLNGGQIEARTRDGGGAELVVRFPLELRPG